MRTRLGVAVLLSPFLATVAVAPPAYADDVAARAAKLHRSAIVVDTHEDVPWELREHWADLGVEGATKHVDIPRLKKGGVAAAFFAVFTPGELAEKGQSAHVALELSDIIDRTVAAHPADLVAATTAAQIRAAHKAGKIAVLKGMEGGHAIEDSLGVLRAFHRLGIRYVTLTHTNSNNWADSLGDFTRVPYDPARTRKHGGLTAFGKEVVLEMNRLGIAVDVSHVSPETLRDVLAVGKAPPFASHSSCRALTDNPRNLTDEQIRAIAAAGGVIMINAASSFLDDEALQSARAARSARSAAGGKPDMNPADEPKPRLTTLARYVDHIEHAMKLAPGAVGLGTDFDGIPDAPRDFADVSYFPKLTEELVRRGHSDREIRDVLGEAFLRYLERVEKRAASP